ncbi:hypothetical protein HY627_00600 [Candidatus Uhrbacteria bacterium]|nr:hypothetical protein [Candidatus Uhrbacteria bacterium]
MKDVLQEIAAKKWLSRWAGSYTFISCTYWGPQYYHSLKKELGVYFKHTLFIHRKGTVSFFVPHHEFTALGKTLARKSECNAAFVKKYCNALKRNTDTLLPMMRKMRKKIPTLVEYKKWLKVFDHHLALHVVNKKTVDFLKDGFLLPLFIDARKYAEHVYSESEDFFRAIAKRIAQREGYDEQYLTCLTKDEFENYLSKKILPKESILRQRFTASVLYFTDDSLTLFTGIDVNRIQQDIADKNKGSNEVRGTSVYPGEVTGKARIVLDPHSGAKFNQGDILITGMTRPEFMPYIKKAGAIVTDVGGVLCHAALTARELKKPCVIGTKQATTVFKNGDRVEVDAEKGIVRRI